MAIFVWSCTLISLVWSLLCHWIKPPCLLWLCNITRFSQTLTIIWSKLSILCSVLFILCLSSRWFVLFHAFYFLPSYSWRLFFLRPVLHFSLPHCSLPLYLIFWLLAFTVLSSSHSMGEFATALPLQGTHSKSLSGFALYTVSNVSPFWSSSLCM